MKADLARANAVLLEVPGLQSTPALAQAVFEYQFEIKQARDAATVDLPVPPLPVTKCSRALRSLAGQPTFALDSGALATTAC